jgi:hypothetical protein
MSLATNESTVPADAAEPRRPFSDLWAKAGAAARRSAETHTNLMLDDIGRLLNAEEF